MDGLVGFAVNKIEKKFPSMPKDVKLQDWIQYGTPVLAVAAMNLNLSWCCCQNGRRRRKDSGRNERRGRTMRYD